MTMQIMNLQTAITFGIKRLSHLENPQLEAEVLLAKAVSHNRTWLKTHPEITLNLIQQLKYAWWLRLRAKHTPSAYVTGQAEWNDLKLKVNRHTLIPRDETETLCHHILAQYLSPPTTILDVGTGSGCIAIFFAKKYPAASLLGLDISHRALQCARYNAKTNNATIVFKQSDLLTIIPKQAHFSLIIANLPYVPENLTVSAEVNKEPRKALFSGVDGLNLIRELATQIKDKKISFDQLWLEFLPESQTTIENIFKNYHVQFFSAINGEIFFACITKNPG